ncbi:MAG: hypothetical protein ACLR4Z_14560 [Butyricicoccaceae bacterium]
MTASCRRGDRRRGGHGRSLRHPRPGRSALPRLHGTRFGDGTAEAISTLAAYQAQNGVAAICPATMTYPEEKLTQIALRRRRMERRAARGRARRH